MADVRDALMGGPKFDEDVTDLFAAIEAERKADFVRAVDFGIGLRSPLPQTVVTRNVKDFEEAGVPVLSPFEPA